MTSKPPKELMRPTEFARAVGLGPYILTKLIRRKIVPIIQIDNVRFVPYYHGIEALRSMISTHAAPNPEQPLSWGKRVAKTVKPGPGRGYKKQPTKKDPK